MGVLKSALFADIQVFEDCATDDRKHIMPGTSGWHIVSIQGALATVGGQKIDEGEVDRRYFGSSTAAAVARFKQSRTPPLLNYKGQIDNIVGKKTIVALDELMARRDDAARRVTPSWPGLDLGPLNPIPAPPPLPDFNKQIAIIGSAESSCTPARKGAPRRACRCSSATGLSRARSRAS